MELNKYEVEYQKLSNLKFDLDKNISQLTQRISWFQSFNVDSMVKRTAGHQSELDVRKQRINNCDREIETLTAKDKRIVVELGSVFNPLNWFQTELRVARKDLQQAIKVGQIEKLTQIEAIDGLEKKIKNIESEIRDFKSVEFLTLEAEYDSCKEHLVLCEVDLAVVVEKKKRLETILAPILREIADKMSEIKKSKNRISSAEHFERGLNEAENSRERAILHEECKRKLDDGRPSKIISIEESKVSRLEADLKYLRGRAKDIDIDMPLPKNVDPVVVKRSIKRVIVVGDGSKNIEVEAYWDEVLSGHLMLDTNIWIEPKYEVFFEFLQSRCRKLQLVLEMPSEVLDEITKMKDLPYDDPKSRLGRIGLVRIEKFQSERQLRIRSMGLIAKRGVYADPVILIDLKRESSLHSRITLITDDRELRIRANEIVAGIPSCDFVAIGLGNLIDDIECCIRSESQTLQVLVQTRPSK